VDLAALALSRRRAWWLALRPFSYSAAVVPVLVGSALAADREFHAGLFLLALLGSVLIQAGTNLATDFFDFTDGVQPRATLGGAIQSGLLTADAVHRAAFAAFAAGSVCGLIIVAYTGWPVLAAGLASVAAGYFYTAGPVMYGRRGLGEVMVFLFMGVLMVMASYYVQVQELTWASLYASLPVGLLVANILHANNLRDIENDRRAGKITIAGMVRRPAADYILYALVIAAYGVVLVCAARGALTSLTLLVLISLPAAVSMFQKLAEGDPARMNPLVRGASMLHLQFGALLALGFLVAAWT
jgi:1,4-dihydroxy-2-naphthoate polyprenyltransferase